MQLLQTAPLETHVATFNMYLTDVHIYSCYCPVEYVDAKYARAF
jgi:hypothetical protein